jgi:hypothetical protein
MLQMDDAIPRPNDPMGEVYPEDHRTDFYPVGMDSPSKLRTKHRYRPAEGVDGSDVLLAPGQGATVAAANTAVALSRDHTVASSNDRTIASCTYTR